MGAPCRAAQRSGRYRQRKHHRTLHGATPPRLGVAGSREGGAARESARRRRRRLGASEAARQAAGAEAQRRRWERGEADPGERGGDGRRQPAAAAAGQARPLQPLQREPPGQNSAAAPQHTRSQEEAATAEAGWTSKEWHRLGRRQARGMRKQEASRSGPLRRDGAAEGQQQQQARRELKRTTEDA